jgi:hypothetical protein
MMSRKLSLAALLLSGSAASVPMASCSSDSSGPSSDAGPDGTGAGSSSSGGSSSSSSSSGSGSGSGTIHDSGITDAAGEAGGLGVLVDNMTTMRGTAIQLQVPAGETPGSYYTYSDQSTLVSNYLGMMSVVTGTSQLVDAPVSPTVPNGDGSQIVGEICFGGRVVNYAGLGMSLAYGNPPDATPESGLSTPVPFDASHYSGVSFYILVSASDASPLPTLHFGVPDSQTADRTALPTSDCAVLDGGMCDDDFGSDLRFTPGQWTKVAFTWDELSQQGFGVPAPTAIKTNQLIGMKWQANGTGVDAAADVFNFCISDIYFTP